MQIRIHISPVGDSTTDAIGFTGEACKHATKPYEDALAGETATGTDKPELHETAAEEQQITA